jgi:hypothetical protein
MDRRKKINLVWVPSAYKAEEISHAKVEVAVNRGSKYFIVKSTALYQPKTRKISIGVGNKKSRC